MRITVAGNDTRVKQRRNLIQAVRPGGTSASSFPWPGEKSLFDSLDTMASFADGQTKQTNTIL
jgi:hypothetical protein